MKAILAPLPYAYNALEPYIDEATMKLHHDKHHQVYVDKLNTVLDTHPELKDKEVEDLIKSLSSLPLSDTEKMIVRNHGGGHINHAFFWSIMGPEKQIDESLMNDIKNTFGSVDEFKKEFAQTALNRFGSGWAWLVKDPSGKLKVYSTANQDSPYLTGDSPLIGLDVWEHAYYLKYQNRRAEYIENWWKVVKII